VGLVTRTVSTDSFLACGRIDPEFPTMNPDPKSWSIVMTYTDTTAERSTVVRDQIGQGREPPPLPRETLPQRRATCFDFGERPVSVLCSAG